MYIILNDIMIFQEFILMNTMTYQITKEKNVQSKCAPKDLFLKRYRYSVWSENGEKSTDKEGSVDLSERIKLDLSKEKNEETGLKILTQNKLLTRLPILLAQIKAGNNSNKLKEEIIQKLYLLYHQNKITKMVYNSLIKSL